MSSSSEDLPSRLNDMRLFEPALVALVAASTALLSGSWVHPFGALVFGALAGTAAALGLARLRPATVTPSKAADPLPLASVSHEIRTPLNGILGMTQLLLNTKPTGQQREYLEAIRFSGQGLMRLIGDMLDYSHIRARALRFQHVSFDLRKWVRETVKSLAPQAHLGGVEIGFWIEPDVPNALHGDPSRLRQVLTNLLANAIQFTEEGEIVLEITRTGGDDQRVDLQFAVSDSGIGIAPERRARIFEAFVQGSDAGAGDESEARGGIGLGLAICKELVCRMNGSLRVESARGLGSTFIFTATFETGEDARPPVMPTETVEGFDILVIDDNPTQRWLVAEQLRTWGFGVVASGAGLPEVMTTVREHAFSLVIVDSKLPEMDPWELSEAIRTQCSAPGILMSLSHEHIDVARLREYGFMGHLTKPIAPEHLLRAIEIVRRGVAVEQPEEVQTTHMDRMALGGTRVLVADDHPVNRAVAVKMLERAGCQVTTAEDGALALDAWKQEPFDIGLLDVQMPELDGPDLARAIRDAEPAGTSLPLIAVTAHTGDAERERCAAAGMNGFLMKPFQEHELFALMRRCLTESDGDNAPAPEVPSFDAENALARAGGDEQLLSELCSLFLTETPGNVEALRRAIAVGEVAAIERLAHRLKGALLTLSAEPAAAVAADIERRARSSSKEDCEALLDTLTSELSRLETTLSALTARAREDEREKDLADAPVVETAPRGQAAASTTPLRSAG